VARETVVTITDDIDGSTAEFEDFAFAVDGKNYEIDLSAANAAKLQEVLAPYIAAARKLGKANVTDIRTRRATPNGTDKPKMDREQTQAIRDWANRNGITVAARGRIPKVVVEAYNSGGKIDVEAVKYELGQADSAAPPAEPKAESESEAESAPVPELHQEQDGPRFADSHEQFVDMVKAWWQNKGKQLNKNGAVPPSAYKAYTAETGCDTPKNREKKAG
jgi:hypothetical protein